MFPSAGTAPPEPPGITIMKYRIQRNRVSHRSSRAPLWGGAFLLLVAALFFLHHRAAGVAAGTRAGDSQSRSSYVNRALWRGPATVRAEAAAQATIKGFIYDADGLALRDATVTAMTFETAGNILQAAGSVRSDELGRFELPLRAGTYQLSAALEGYGPASATAHSGDSVSLVLPRSGAIDGRVVDERGNPVSRFVIDVVVAAPGDMPAPPTVFSRRFDSLDGSFRVDQLPVWDVIVRASAEGYAPAYSEDLGVKPGETTKLELKLSRGCAIAGKVEDPTGKPVPNVLVDAEARFGSGSFSDSAMQTPDQAESERDGSFRLANVPIGSVVVRAYDGSHAVTGANIEITDCAKVEPVKLVMTAGGSIVGVARGGDGQPISGARLTLSHRAVGFVTVTSDEKGSFRFEQIPVGSASIELSYQGRNAKQGVKVEGGKEVQKDIALIPDGSGGLRGRVTAGGKPLSGVKLMVVASHGVVDGLDAYYPVTGEDGTYQVDKLPKGIYLVNVTSHTASRGARVNADEVATLDIDLSAQPVASRARKGARKPK
jgi:hypothetical protein